jgi:hypothetical protein
MRFSQHDVVADLSDAGAKGREHIGEQQSDQLLSGRGGPVLRDFRHERVAGGLHYACIVHPLTRKLFGKMAGRSRSIHHCLHGKAFERSVNGREDEANVGGYACHDQVLAPRGEHRIAEVGIGLGVDDAGTPDPRGMRFGQDRGDFRMNRALGAVFLTGRAHDRQIEDLRHLGQRNRLPGCEFLVNILDQFHRANVMVNQQQGGVVGSESLNLRDLAPK